MREIKWVNMTKCVCVKVRFWWIRNISTCYSTRPAKLFVKPTQPDPPHLIDLHGLSWVGSGWAS